METPDHGGQQPPPSYRRTPSSLRESPEAGPPTAGSGPPGGGPRRLPPWAITVGLPALVAVLALVGLTLWVRADRQVGHPAPREPMPEVPAVAAAPAPPVEDTDQTPVHPDAPPPGAPAPAPGAPGAAPAPSLPGSWPAFRGPRRDGVSRETVSLTRTWGAQGPRPLWSVDLGEGYAAPAVHDGKVYLLDYDAQARADVLRCLALADGRELWRQSYPADVRRNHGMSRTVPAVTDRYVVTLGPLADAMGADAQTGQVRWRMNLVERFGATVPQWYVGQCPLIDGNRAIFAPGGRALMIAVDLASGEVVWQTPNPQGWKMTHSSIMPVEHGGQRQYIYCYDQGVAGISASDGKLLWSTTEWRVSTATIPTPVPVGGGKVFLSGGYNSGGMMLQLRSGAQAPQVLFRVPPNVFQSAQHTPVLHEGHLYGVRQGGELVCLDLSGKQVWSSGSTRFGLGPYLIAQGLIYALAEDGTLRLVEATAAGFRPLAQAKVLPGPEAWGPLALAGGRLLARDLHRMVCLDVSG